MPTLYEKKLVLLAAMKGNSKIENYINLIFCYIKDIRERERTALIQLKNLI